MGGNKELVNEFSENVDLRFSFDQGKKLSKRAKISTEGYRPNKFVDFFNFGLIFDPLNSFKFELKKNGFTPFAIYKSPQDEDLLVIKVELPEGILNFAVPKRRITNSSKTVFVLWMLLTAVLTSIISIIFLRNQVRSIKDLNLAADKFGRDQDVPDFKPSGAAEIRSVGISFIKMRERIARQVSQRTDMLSGVSHDLRTPLTRMKLQLEMMGDSVEIKELKEDISDMEKMINEYLEFARGGDKEKNKNTKIEDFLKKMIIYYKKSGKEILFDSNLKEDLQINIKRNTLKRAIRNLIDNALNYGTEVKVSAMNSDNNLKIIVDDNGPGVPEAERENIFKPFYRIDNSRNLDKTGVGLGLSIVLDAVNSHGGRVKLSDSPLGGLRVIIYLPI